MAKYSNTKAKINEKITANTVQAITGNILNDVLQTMVDSLGADYQFGGLIQPGSPFTAGEQPVVFLATTPGTYTNFGGLVVADGEVALLVWSGTAWSKQTPDIATRTEVSQLGQELDKALGITIINDEYDVTGNNKYISCLFKQGKKYFIKFSWSYTSGLLQRLVVRNGEGPLVGITPYYDASSGVEAVEFDAAVDYDNLIIQSYGTVDGDVTLEVYEPKTVEEIEEEITELRNEKVTLDKLGGPVKGAVNEAIKRLGYSIELNNMSADASIPSTNFVAPIPIGTTIINNGIKVKLFSDSTYTTYKELLNGDSWVATFAVNLIRTLEDSGNVILVIDTRNKLLDNVKIDGQNIKQESIDIKSLSFTESGINIYDKDSDQDFAEGKYLNQWGGLNNNSDYNTSGFIKVEPNTAYSYIPDAAWRFVLEFDENFDAISSTYVQSVRTITTSANTRYIRLTFYADPGKYFLCTGSEPKPYEDYKVFIPSEYVQDGGESSVLFFLPKHIYVANGRTIEIYYNQIMLYAERYNIKATCSIGKALDRKFQIIGDSSHIGNYTLSIVAYDDKDNVVASGTSTIHIVANTISSSKTVLPVGDSLTNDKPWLSELHTLSGNLSTVGTRQEFHEGRSGANVSTYTNVSGGIVYDFDNQFSESGVPTFDETTSYAIGDKVKIAHTFGNGASGYRYWVFKQAHTPGAFVESEAYCYSGGNPFYDYANDKFSMSFYRSFFGKNFDAIVLYLGTNGINLEPETNVNGALGIKNLIELIREDETTTPIVVVNTIFRSSQNGIGNQGNTDGYVAQSEYKYNADKKVLLLAKAIEKLCGSMSNVYLCPVGFTHDSKYNFGNTKVQVNPRIDSTDVVFELQPSDSVHPQTSGYMQMADEIFSTLCAVFNP